MGAHVTGLSFHVGAVLAGIPLQLAEQRARQIIAAATGHPPSGPWPPLPPAAALRTYCIALSSHAAIESHLMLLNQWALPQTAPAAGRGCPPRSARGAARVRS